MNQRFLLLALSLLSVASQAQDLPTQSLPKAIATLAEISPVPQVSISHDGAWRLVMDVQELPTAADMQQPELRLAGLRINPRTNGPSRVSYATALRLKHLPNGKELLVQGLPAKPRISEVTWSPDNTKIAFTHTKNNHIELWIVDVESASARLAPNLFLNGIFGSSYEWVSDSKTLLVRAIVGGRGEPPVPPAGSAAPAASTPQGLLKTPADELLFNYYALAQVVKLSIDGRMQPMGSPGIIQQASPSPNGQFALIKTRHRPFSTTLPVSSFPVRVEILNMEGLVVKELAEIPLITSLPATPDVVTSGQRSHNWREDAPATVYWVEAQDGGNPKTASPIRDKIFGLASPFDGKPLELASLPLRFANIYWGTDNLAIVQGHRSSDRRQTMWTLDLATKTSLAVLFDRLTEDTYADPGTPYVKHNEQGRPVLVTDAKGDIVYMFGKGASPHGDRPFVDELNVRTKKSVRWWRSEAPFYEVPVAIFDPSRRQLITRRESVTEVPNYFLREARSGRLTPLTTFTNPYASLSNLKKQVLTYKRTDSVELTATLYLPATYKKEDGPLPTLLDVNPVVAKAKKEAGPVKNSPYKFVRMGWGSPVFWTTQGYAVLQGASMPMLADGVQEPTEAYTAQLVASAKAAIKEGQRLGAVDTARVAIVGHSYGAGIAANVLAHSNLFRAGIMRTDRYDQALAPFDSQGEEISSQPAPDTYKALLPFTSAAEIKTPLLFVNGEVDSQAGTGTAEVERFYNVLKGQGSVVQYVAPLAGSNGYATREATMQALREMNTWLETHLTSTPTTSQASSSSTTDQSVAK
ncbi:prolyl oligopeptidase family serine peptidase [Hymenobacter tibetensis]|uniref:Prolyl oligopeptidase family serine peptidase n=1 Tax=Hymenobacter tibetensis TaxID=497967 RepID=A0ABY4D387_9BACT|nr:prolyl oligopeptidase family serine peptidase [Hymenobacter tibetensis]UOG75674.1 prolyl oligopeptidase family serine peptidase [Hymenobacter tibetensis]